MKWRVVGSKKTGFKAQYKRANLWCYVTDANDSAAWPKYTVRTFSTREVAEQYAKQYAQAYS